MMKMWLLSNQFSRGHLFEVSWLWATPTGCAPTRNDGLQRKKNCEISTNFLPWQTCPVSRVLGPSWPACRVDVGVRREVDRGRQSQQTKVILVGVGVPIWVLKFPASEAYERVHILLLLRMSQAQYWMLVSKVFSISHASQEEILS